MMKIVFPDFKDCNISRNRLLHARRISKFVKVDYITPRHIGFTVTDPYYKTKHSVIYFSEKEFPKSWNCDCHWHSIKSGLCKHILSVFIRLEEDSNFLKRFKKEKLKNIVQKDVCAKPNENKKFKD
ncbi:MAG: hypothetical protein J7K22_02870 [Nanoarchaeota archaeon]|nr:hypothetical protein [Nanoarchaeota archaeon]